MLGWHLLQAATRAVARLSDGGVVYRLTAVERRNLWWEIQVATYFEAENMGLLLPERF